MLISTTSPKVFEFDDSLGRLAFNTENQVKKWADFENVEVQKDEVKIPKNDQCLECKLTADCFPKLKWPDLCRKYAKDQPFRDEFDDVHKRRLKNEVAEWNIPLISSTLEVSESTRA